jgi:hypothetical protein
VNRTAIAVFTASTCFALASCGPASAPASPLANPPATPHLLLLTACKIDANGYAVKFANPSDQAIQITGFSVTFSSDGQETGSDTEPGNGTITDPDTNGPAQTINMNDWIAPNGTFTYQVQPSNGMPQADTCQIVNWSSQ